MLTIRNKRTNRILILEEKEQSLKDCVEENKMLLYGAELHHANLRGANLQGAVLRYVSLWCANLQGALLRDADLRGALLHGAVLRDADLRDADLRYTDLRGADLQGADLRGADLRGADLHGAKIRGDFYKPPLYALKFQPEGTKLTFWLAEPGYEPGKEYEFPDANRDERILYASGGNVATLAWCLENCEDNVDEFLEVEFTVDDIAAIPFATRGQLRVKRFTILRGLSHKRATDLLESRIS